MALPFRVKCDDQPQVRPQHSACAAESEPRQGQHRPLGRHQPLVLHAAYGLGRQKHEGAASSLPLIAQPSKEGRSLAEGRIQEPDARRLPRPRVLQRVPVEARSPRRLVWTQVLQRARAPRSQQPHQLVWRGPLVRTVRYGRIGLGLLRAALRLPVAQLLPRLPTQRLHRLPVRLRRSLLSVGLPPLL